MAKSLHPQDFATWHCQRTKLTARLSGMPTQCIQHGEPSAHLSTSVWVRLCCLLLWPSLGCDTDPSSSAAPSNQAQFLFDCDLNGVTGNLVLNVEVVSSSGVTFGAGPTPDITGVIATGDVKYYTWGEVSSPSAYYVFTGENRFADFTETATSARFRVQWGESSQGLVMVVNPFGPGPTYHECVLTNAQYL